MLCFLGPEAHVIHESRDRVSEVKSWILELISRSYILNVLYRISIIERDVTCTCKSDDQRE